MKCQQDNVVLTVPARNAERIVILPYRADRNLARYTTGLRHPVTLVKNSIIFLSKMKHSR